MELDISHLEGHEEAIHCLCLDGQQAVSGSDDKSCIVWDTSLGLDSHVLKCSSEITALAFENNEIISGCEDGSAKFWQLNKETVLLLLLLIIEIIIW